MDQIQPLKKRIVEPQRTYAKSSIIQQQRQPQFGQYYQYVSVSELKSQTPHQNHQQQHQPEQLQNMHQQQQKEPNSNLQPLQQLNQQAPQMIQYEYYEPPMTLNAWTQTNPDEFPNTPSTTDFKNAALLAKIQELEQSLKLQTEELNSIQKLNIRSPSPDHVVSNSSTMMPSELKHEGTTYRILTQSNSETQIEIELSEDAESNHPNISPAKVYTLHTIPETLSPHICDQKVVNSIPTKSSSDGSMVSIGPNDTKIPAAEFEKMSWASASIATRKLLAIIFSRETLATHSMTGKASPAFKDLDKPVKGKLDPNAIQDIIFIVSKKCRVSAKEVRSAITTKCADENKMLKLKEIKEMKRLGLLEPKRTALSEINKLNNNGFDKENI